MSNSINEAQHNYGKAVQIFCQNPNGGKFQLEVDAINSILNKIGNLPLVIYSVNGAKQTGKSFLLNFMMLYLAKFKNHFDEFSESDFLNNCTDIPSGFESRNDHDGVTVGMWLWSEPFIVKHQGREIAILLLDTQGHFDDRFERLKSSLIFALSTLLSDIFIYNAMLDISAERDLQFLQLFLDYSKKIGCNEQDKLKCALMLVRDFRPTLKYPYGYYDNTQKPSNKEPCSEEPCSKEPCNFAIDKLSPDSPLCLPEQLGFREEIHKCFDRVGCFLMPHPGLAIHSGSRNVLMEREFQDMLITFMKTIFSEPIFSIKTIAGQEITGRSLSQFVLQWNNEINTKEQPSILGFLEANEQVNNQMLIEKQLQIYQNEMNKFNIAMDETKLFNEHQKLASKCVSEYENALKLGSEEVHLRFKETFQTNIEVQWEGYRAKNSEKSLNKLNTEIRETLDDYNKKMANFCVKAISEECLVDEHKRLVELYMKRFDDDDEWKVGSAKDRNEFKVYFDRYIAKDMLNFWNENNCKSQESLSKL
jgi:atlastin